MAHKKHKGVAIVPKSLLKPSDGLPVQKQAAKHPHQPLKAQHARKHSQRAAAASARTVPAQASVGVFHAGGKQQQHQLAMAGRIAGTNQQDLSSGPGSRRSNLKRPRKQSGLAKQADDSAVVAAAAAAACQIESAALGAEAAAEPQQPPSKRQKRAQAIARKTAALAAVPTTIALPNPMQPAVISSNWQAMKGVIKEQDESRKRKLPAAGGHSKKPGAIGSTAGVTTVLAIDCEMVGVGPNGDRSALARVCVVNNFGNVLLDTYVKPKEKIVDYRTKYSGIRPEHLVDAMSWEDAQKKVAELVQAKVLVGHAISNDLAVLLLSHPKKLIRDTSRYPPLMFTKRGKKRAQALRVLAERELGLKIQEGEHNPVDDARAALYLYHKHRKDWEAAIQSGSLKLLKPTSGALGIVRKASKKRVDYAMRDIKDDPLADL
jgi:RNA exonuclease 4